MASLEDKILGEGVTFDDLLLVPAASNIPPDAASTETRLTRGIRIGIPLLSAPMDTVTEAPLAIALAQEGGIGIVHKNLDVESQATAVRTVKRSQNGVISDPVTLRPDDGLDQARTLMSTHHVSGFPITEDGTSRGRLMGILTSRDMKWASGSEARIQEVMTRENLVTAPAETTLEEAEALLNNARVEKLLLVDPSGHLAGLITMRDIEKVRSHPMACRDDRGRLRVGAAVGVHQYERVAALVEAEVDVLIVDTAHGHSRNVLETVKEVKSKFDIEVIAGNVGTADGAKALIDAGADAVKVGIGPGSICTTRVVTGVGVPQLTAVSEAVSVAEPAGVPVIADGGIRQSGDIGKAIAAGASSVMLGSMFAGLDESPGEVILRGGRRFKTYRGMGSEGAMAAGSADRYAQGERESRKFVPEGVEGAVPYRGSLSDLVYQFVGGLRSTMGYCGCGTIDELRNNARFVRITGASLVESHPHDITITRESSNYTTKNGGN